MPSPICSSPDTQDSGFSGTNFVEMRLGETDQRYTLVTFQFLNKSKCASTWFKKERDISKDGWPKSSWD